MNVAFPALLIFLLVLPGLIFNLAFYQTENAPLKYISLTHKAFVCSAFAILLHAIWLYLIVYLFLYNVNVDLILILLSGAKDSKFSSAIATITTHEVFISAIYLISLYLGSYLLGISLRWCIRRFQLEKFNIFRIDSPWYYLFTGYDWKDGKPAGVRIAAIVEIAGKGYLYVGWLDKFYLDNNGSIDRLILTGAMRREIEKDKKIPESDSLVGRFYPIDGHYFVLKYSEAKSLNVQFIQLEELKK